MHDMTRTYSTEVKCHAILYLLVLSQHVLLCEMSVCCMLPMPMTVFIGGDVSFSSPAFCCLPQLLQAQGSPSPPALPSASSFTALLQAAYESQALRDKHIQVQLQASMPRLPMQQVLRAAKQVLLYLRSTVENFGQVSVAPSSARPRALPPESSAFSESGPQLSTLLLPGTHCRGSLSAVLSRPQLQTLHVPQQLQTGVRSA